MDDGESLDPLRAAHVHFLQLVKDVRPELHRYCARMTGSIVDGEDVVQEALARAYYELSQLRELPALRTWLFRIAHHRAIDHLRRRQQHGHEQPLDESLALAADVTAADEQLERSAAVDVAIGRFVALAPAQRACVILKDVLGYSLDELTAMLDLSLAAVKAALHRGRVRLREVAEAPPGARPPFTPAIVRYVDLFNARDWDGVRAMLVDDVKLELVSRERRNGRASVAKYFTNYDAKHDWHLGPAWLDGREVLAVRRSPTDARPSYVIELTLAGDRVSAIRDFRYVPYVADEAVFEEPAA